MSNTLPWRTLVTASMPSDLSAPSIALPCGSRMPDFSVTVTRAFMPASVSRRRRPRFCGGSPSAARLRVGRLRVVRLREQAAVARQMAAVAGKPHRRPECGLRARHHRNAVARFQRLGDIERAQASARDQQALRTGRVSTNFVAERDDIILALAA